MEQERKKPSCPLVGQNGNIFNLIGLASRTLRQNGMTAEAKEMQNRIMGGDCHSYEEALGIISEYVETELSGSSAYSKNECQKYFDYLERLRQSGETNMYGAVPYLQEEFPELRYSPERARKILLAWFGTFREKEADTKC